MAYPFNQYGYYPQIPQQYSPNIPQNQQMQPQIQNGGFVVIPKEDVVYNYPVAMGNCVTFKVEGQPIVLEKTGPLSQFDTPKIARYRLVKEEMPSQEPQEPHTSTENNKTVNSPHYVLFDEFKAVKAQIDGILADIDTLKEKVKNGKVEDDE